MVLCPCYAGCSDRYNTDYCLGGKFESFNLAVYNGAWTEAGKIAKEISNMKVVERRANAVEFLSECMQKHHILWDTISKIFSDQSSRKLIMTALLMYYDQIDNGPQIYTKPLFLMPELTDYYKEFESLLSETPVVSFVALASCAGNIIDYLNQKYFITKW